MRSLAAYIMKGEKQAALCILFSIIIPATFWLGSSCAALYVLRKGLEKSINLVFIGIIAGLFWLAKGSPAPIISFIGTVILACLLRKSASWTHALMLLIPFGLFVVWIVTSCYMTEFMQSVSVILKSEQGLISNLIKSSKNLVLKQSINDIVLVALIKTYTGVVLSMTVISLALSRYWQAALYNPGGFKKEIHSLRLGILPSFVLISLWIGTNFTPGVFLKAISPCFSIPLIVAGIGLVHYCISIAHKNKQTLLLTTTYLILIISYPLIIFLASIDSVINFRSKIALKMNKNSKNL